MKGIIIDTLFYIILIVAGLCTTYQLTESILISLIIMLVVAYFVIREGIKEQITETDITNNK